MKRFKFFIPLILLSMVASFFISCDKGTDTVGFDYYMDANDRRVVHFNAKGKSDYGSFEYTWSFGDGSTGQGKDITHEFSDFGRFTVILTATIDDSNIETTVSKEIEVVIPKITDLDFEVVPDKQNPRLYNFKAVSNTDFGNVKYEWDFGDGMTASGEIVQYGFEYFGIYEIGLKSKISEYEKIESIRKKYVNIAAPAITRLEIYAEQDDDDPFLYHFKPIAEATWGTLEYEWSFGDGKIAYDIEEPTNTYGKYASYDVQLKAKIKETGATRTEIKKVTVQTPVFKNYEITHKIDPNDPLSVSFTIENKDGDEEEDMSQQDSFLWEFGDGNTASGLRVNYRYESYGEKTIYVTLRTAQQTQKTLTKDIVLETPAIKNIKITGQPSMKAGNLIEYRVTAESKFEDEIEYEWEFEDGTRKNGRAVEREMSYWQQPDRSGNITEKIYMRVSIPRLNVSIRDTEPYEVKVIRPTIKNFNVSCVQSSVNPKEFICDVRDTDGKRPTSSTGGNIEYEWVFNGQTYTGSSQRLTVEELDRDYNLYVTATIEDTNISESIPKILSVSDDMLGMDCSTPIVYSTDEEALKMTCQPLYNSNIHTGMKVKWDYGDGSIPTEDTEHVYDKAGIYTVKMIFNSNQISTAIKERKYAVLVKVEANTTVSKGGDRASVCGGSIYDDRAAFFWNNFDMFNQEDFTVTNVFSGGGSCKCSGKNGTDNTWHTNGTKIYGYCWGNLNQYVKTTICPNGFSAEYCINSD